MQTPISARLVDPTPEGEEPEPAAAAVLSLVAIVQDSILFHSSDLFPALVTHEDGTQSIILVISIEDPRDDNKAGFGIAGILFSNAVSSEAEADYAKAVQKLVLAALDAEAAQPAVATPTIIEQGQPVESGAVLDSNQATDERYAAEEES